MQDGKDAQVRGVLRAEIDALQKYYATLNEFVAGKEYDSIEIAATLQVFKESLNRITSHILTLYVLNKQKTKITWEPLLENLENATATTRAAKGNVRSAIELAFNMSEPNAQEVMAYLAKLKESLQ
jgi:hypothetical protein